VHFDINSQNPERVMKFYEKVFDWKFTRWKGPFDYWFIQTGEQDKPGIDGGLSKTDDPGMTTSVTVETDDIDKTIDLIKENGGRIIADKNAIPGIGWYAGFEDTEGNQLGIMQDDPQAK
jgi:predicted enzyme related to lactoylglutathione lyase